jgi:hypothetical protein
MSPPCRHQITFQFPHLCESRLGVVERHALHLRDAKASTFKTTKEKAKENLSMTSRGPNLYVWPLYNVILAY